MKITAESVDVILQGSDVNLRPVPFFPIVAGWRRFQQTASRDGRILVPIFSSRESDRGQGGKERGKEGGKRRGKDYVSSIRRSARVMSWGPNYISVLCRSPISSGTKSCSSFAGYLARDPFDSGDFETVLSERGGFPNEEN